MRAETENLTCFPGFYLAGFPKCGTTDLFARLVLHPSIVQGCRKEPHYWTRLGYGRPLKTYTNCYREISKVYTQWWRKQSLHQPNYMAIDASASTLWDHHSWRKLPGNNVTSGYPSVTTANIIHHVTPDAKFIVLLRNPVDRLYSDYTYFSRRKKASPTHFHRLVVKGTNAARDCINQHGLNWCAFRTDLRMFNDIVTYDDDDSDDDDDDKDGDDDSDDEDDDYTEKINYRFTLYTSLYVLYIEKWLEVFPRSQMYFIRSEDFREDIEAALLGVFKFLGITKPVSMDFNEMEENKKMNKQKSYKDMLPKTRDILIKFYRPYNIQLTRLLNDERYMWLD